MKTPTCSGLRSPRPNHAFFAPVVAIALLSAPGAHADRKWNSANDPRQFDATYTLNFNKLSPLTQGDVRVSKDGKPTYKGWSESFFPKNRGYIAERWQDPAAKFKFKSNALPTGGADALKALGQTGLNLLSPAEKIEIAMGRYDFPLTRKIMKDTEPKPKEWWKGLCDGWTTASLNIDEPRPIVYVTKRDKIEVPFTSSDIKGLLAWYYARVHEAPVSYLGKSCRAGKKLMLDIDGSCKDLNAGAFHVALINEIGIKHRGFAMDRDPTVQVWNQPILKYETSYSPRAVKSSKASEEARREIDVTTTITFANELYDTDDEELEDDEHAAPSAEPVLGTAKQKYRTRTYQYVIELDAYDNVIGGDWTGGDEHPDMIWRHQFKLPIGEWSVLKDIVKQATAYAGEPTSEPAAEPAAATAPVTEVQE